MMENSATAVFGKHFTMFWSLLTIPREKRISKTPILRDDDNFMIFHEDNL